MCGVLAGRRQRPVLAGCLPFLRANGWTAQPRGVQESGAGAPQLMAPRIGIGGRAAQRALPDCAAPGVRRSIQQQLDRQEADDE